MAKHHRASRTKRGQKSLVVEITILNGIVGLIITPLNTPLLQFFANLSPSSTGMLQTILPFIIFPVAALAIYLYLSKNVAQAALAAVATALMVGVYTFTNRYFISLVLPQAAIAGGLPAQVSLPYVTIGIASLLFIAAYIYSH